MSWPSCSTRGWPRTGCWPRWRGGGARSTPRPRGPTGSMRSTPARPRKPSSRRARTCSPSSTWRSATSPTSGSTAASSTTTTARSASPRTPTGTGPSTGPLTRGVVRSMPWWSTRPRRSRAIRPVSKSSTGPRWSRWPSGTARPAPPPPATIGEIALGGAYWYHNALVNTEIQGGGRRVLEVWREAGYTNIWTDRRPDKVRRSGAVLGWNTTYETKQWMLATLQGVLKRHDIIIHHPTTRYEMTQYTSLGDGTFGPARRSGHDDCVMSLGIAVMTCVTEWSSLDMNAVMGTDQRGEQTPNAARLTFAGAGTPVEVLPGAGMDRDLLPVYALAGEIDDWL